MEKDAIESFEKVAEEYRKYLERYVPIKEGDSAEPLLYTQAEIIGHLVYIARPLGFHRRREKELRADYLKGMRTKRAKLIHTEKSAAAAEAKAKAEFAHLDCEAMKHEGIADELFTLYQIGDSIRFAISQHVKTLTNEKIMVRSDVINN